MVATNLTLVVAPSLEMYFVDKDTGLPLDRGKVYSWRDASRSVPKTLYDSTGAPLPNPSTLSAVGTFQDAGNNNILPYYWPYDGTPTDSQGTEDLYYIEVKDKNGVLQFTRDAWPGPSFTGSTATTTSANITNYITNSQFTLNNYGGSTTAGAVPGTITATETALAPGGWWFNRSSASVATDIITFEQLTIPGDVPANNPRFALQYQETASGADTLKDIVVRFPNVATFQEALNNEFYYQFSANNPNAQINNVEIIIYYFFGTGTNSPTAPFTEVQNTVNLFNGWNDYNSVVRFMDLTTALPAYTIGDNNDDYVAIGIRMPNLQCTVQFTNFALTYPGNPVAFPQTDAPTQIGSSMSGYLPFPTTQDVQNYNLYLPIVRGLSGETYDYRQVGKVEIALYGNSVLGPNELETNGDSFQIGFWDSTSQVSLYSSTGIPYARLGSVFWNATISNYIFGGPSGYYTAVYPSSTGVTASLRITQNGQGVVTTFADVDSGITATQIYTGVAAGTYLCSANVINTDIIQIIGTYADKNGASATCPTIAITQTGTGLSNAAVIDGKESANVIETSVIQDQYTIQVGAATLFANSGTGDSFTFKVVAANGTSITSVTVWYNIGTTVAPAGSPLVQVNLLVTDTANDVAQKTWLAINNFDAVALTVLAGSSYGTGGTGKSFKLTGTGSSPTYKYQYWFNVNGGQTAPTAAAGYTLVQIPISDTSTVVEVIEALVGSYSGLFYSEAFTYTLGINTYFYKLPDLRGWILRGVDNNAGIDTQVLNRFSYLSNYAGDKIGTMQLDFVRQHFHYAGDVGTQYTGGAPHTPMHFTTTPDIQSANFGTTENLVKNFYVNYIIKY